MDREEMGHKAEQRREQRTSEIGNIRVRPKTTCKIEGWMRRMDSHEVEEEAKEGGESGEAEKVGNGVGVGVR